MNTAIDRLKALWTEHQAFLLYGLISVFVTVIDVAASRISENLLGLTGIGISVATLIANTIGVVTGFIIQYFLTAKYVYHTQNVKSFSIFLGTFFMNLFFASSIIFLFRTVLFHNSNNIEAFLIAKGASIVLPFFVTYFIRKKLMPSKDSKNTTK